MRHTGEGEGFSTGFVAVGGYTPLLEPDMSFGGPRAPAQARATPPRRRARVAAQLRRVLVRVTTSGAGLVQVRVRDARGRVPAQGVGAVDAAGTSAVRVGLTTNGRRILRRGRSLRVRVGHDLRDVLTARAGGVLAGRLR